MSTLSSPCLASSRCRSDQRAGSYSGRGRMLGGLPGGTVVEIAIYPDVVWLAARSLREYSTSHREAS